MEKEWSQILKENKEELLEEMYYAWNLASEDFNSKYSVILCHNGDCKTIRDRLDGTYVEYELIVQRAILIATYKEDVKCGMKNALRKQFNTSFAEKKKKKFEAYLLELKNKLKRAELTNSFKNANRSYKEFSKHRDLIAFVVCSEYFFDSDEQAFFNEAIVVVDKEWLFDYMRKEDIDDPLGYLREAYTTKDAYEWYEKAKDEGQIVSVSVD